MRSIAFSIFFFLIAGSSPASAETRLGTGTQHDPCDGAKPIVQKFLDLDLSGETLHQSDAVDSLIDFKGRDLPGWDAFDLTKSATIQSCKTVGKAVDVTVAYHVYGTLSGETHPSDVLAATTKPTHLTTNKFHVESGPGGWKIDSLSIEHPHVDVASAKKHVK